MLSREIENSIKKDIIDKLNELVDRYLAEGLDIVTIKKYMYRKSTLKNIIIDINSTGESKFTDKLEYKKYIQKLIKEVMVDRISEADTLSLQENNIITKFDIFNESLLTEKMTPKMEDNLKKELKKLSELSTDSEKIKYIIKKKLPFEYLPKKLIIIGNLLCKRMKIKELPDNLTVLGNLDCAFNRLTKLPKNLIVKGNLNCHGNNITEFPSGLDVTGDLDCYYNKISTLPKYLNVGGNLHCRYNPLPDDTKKPVGVKGKMEIGEKI